MVDIHHESIADAPASVAFAYIDDPDNVAKWMFGVSRFVPVDPAQRQGLGAVYDSIFQVKPVKLTTRVEITAWQQDELIELTSIKGFTNSSTWRFEAEGPERTRLTVKFSYEFPGGLAGKAMGRAFEPIVALSVKQSEASLRKNIAEVYAARNT